MNPVYVAIDVPDVHRAAAIARQVCGLAGGVKLGLEFFCANGDEGVLRIAEHRMPIFLDLKLHDIPNTVGKAVEALAHLEPAILTVHASGGRAMMEAARAAAPPRTKVVAVTVLTSLDQRDLAAAGVEGSPADQVRRLADLARESRGSTVSCVPEAKSQPRMRHGRTAFSSSPESALPAPTLPTRSGWSRRARRSTTGRRSWSLAGRSPTPLIRGAR